MATPLTSVDNALRLLLVLQDGRPLRVTDAAEHLGVSRPTAHRLLASLAHRRFVEQDHVTRAYVVADALVRNWLPPAAELIAAATPTLRALARRTGQTAHLGVLNGTSVSLVASARGARAGCAVSFVGTTFPAHFSAAGKALLAELPMHELERRYASEPLRKSAWRRTKLLRESDGAIWQSLLAELCTIRSSGFATNFRGHNRSVNAIAVPIRLGAGTPPGVLILSAPSATIGRRAMVRYVQELKLAAAQVATRLVRPSTPPREMVL